ncbi:MAG: ribonuclease P protein component [Anaerolineae bacterium]|nr:ribonuclease P protein component [Candidatus Roseilinea sp.]MDW8449603.1 ribonuclease P protein component [Anaerolineae bacterium]
MLERLARKEDFERVRREGARWRGRYCTLNAARAPAQTDESQEPRTRVGYIAPRTVSSAVKRNRARRLLREAMRQLADSVVLGWDIVLIAQPSIIAESARMQQVREDLQWLLNKAHLMRTAPIAK